MDRNLKVLEFDKIIETLAEYAASGQAKEIIRNLVPFISESELRKNLSDTTQARQMLDSIGTPPAASMENMEELLGKAVRYDLLMPEELEQVGMFLTAVKRMKEYLERGKAYRISLAYYEENLILSEEIREELMRCVRHGKIDDQASAALRDMRRDIQRLEEKIKE